MKISLIIFKLEFRYQHFFLFIYSNLIFLAKMPYSMKSLLLLLKEKELILTKKNQPCNDSKGHEEI